MTDDEFRPLTPLEKALTVQALRHIGRDKRWRIVWKLGAEYIEGHHFWRLGVCQKDSLTVFVDGTLPRPKLLDVLLHEFSHAMISSILGQLPGVAEDESTPALYAGMTEKESQRLQRSDYRLAGMTEGVESWALNDILAHVTAKSNRPTHERMADRIADMLKWYIAQQAPDGSWSHKFAALARWPAMQSRKIT